MSPFSAHNFRLPGNRKGRAARAHLAGRAGITLSVMLVATLLPSEAWAAPPGDRSGVKLPTLQDDRPAKADQIAIAQLDGWDGDPPAEPERYKPTAVSVPDGSPDIPVTLPPPSGTDFLQVGELPVSLGKAAGTGAAPSGTWTAGVQAPATVEAAGVDGAVIKITPPADAVNSVDIALDYSKFEDLYGTEWSARLKLRQYPACFIDHPEDPGCAVSIEVPTTNVSGDKKVIATVDPTATPTSGMTAMTGGSASPMAVVASDSGAGAGGTYRATSLSPSGSWTAGASGGGFSWTYPLAVPPAPAGPTPSIAFSYSSQAVDGKTSVTNSQASWIGDGWDYHPGFIERRYRTCSEDRKPSPTGGKANNDNTTDKKKGDLCWAGDSVILSLGGSTTELVHDEATGKWVPATDDGSVVELKTGGDSRVKNGEYWVVTTRDGTRYHYGRHSVGTHGDGTDPKNVTESVFTVPVFGNHPGEPCHATAYKDSSCRQAWRWNLDYVEDIHGNAMIIDWAKEENRYAKNEKANEKSPDAVGYTRGGYPVRILYGLRADNLAGAPAAKVEFEVKQRCFAEKDIACDDALFGTQKTVGWWDTPASLNCKMNAATCVNFSPTFWSRMRLDRVITSAQRTEGSTQLTKVDQWALKQSLPGHRTDTSPPLWLESITRTGYGSKNSTIGVPLPAVSFQANKVDMPNRVLKAPGADNKPDRAPDFDRLRLQTILTETGGEIEVNYSAPCATGTTVADQAKNTTRCFPAHWSADTGLDPDKTPPLELFNKYVVESVVERDRVAKRPPVTTSYEYKGGAAWAKEDDEFTKPERRTYSQWRGYAEVVTTTGATENTGTPTATEQSQTSTRYFRGLSTGTSPIVIKDSTGTTELGEDKPQYQGMPAETITYTRAGTHAPNEDVESRELTRPQSAETARRKRPDTSDLVAYRMGVDFTENLQSISGGKARKERSTNTYEGPYGLLKATQTDAMESSGTGWTTVKQSCTVPTYVHNPASNLIGLPAEVRETTGDCSGGGIEPGTTLSATRTSYDALNAFGAAPTKGMPFQVETLDGAGTGWAASGRTEYDSLGRVVKVYDAVGNPAAVTFSPPTGPAFAVTTTNALGHTVTTKVDPARGSVLEAIDANGRAVTTTYDELGRTTEVRTPSQKPTDKPAYTFEYQIEALKEPAVTTRRLKDNGTYSTSIAIYDGLLRPRQTKTEGPGGAVLVTETLHTANGTVSRTNNGYLADTKLDTELFVPESDTLIPNATQTAYDGLGRPVRTTTLDKGTPKHATTTQYGGDWTLTRTAMSPTGNEALPGSRAVKTSTDALGRTSLIEHYTATTATAVNPTVVDNPHTNKTRYTYDTRGKLAKVTDAALNNWTYTYDARGRMTASDDPDMGKSTFTYNNLDQQVSATSAHNVTQYTTYDALRRKTALRDGSVNADPTATWTYDTLTGGKGQPVAVTRKWADGKYYKTEVTGYDSEYRPTGSRITIPDLPSTTGLAGTYAYSTTYTPTGQVQSTTLPATVGGLAAEKLVTRYNADGMVQTVSGLSWYTADTIYSPYGEVLRTASGNAPHRVWTSNNYDPHTGRLARATSHRETADTYSKSNLLAALDYSYDTAGNPTSTTDTYPDTRSTATENSSPLVDRQCFTYDAIGQLTQAWTGSSSGCPSSATGPALSEVASSTPGDAYWQEYSFDAIGNRTKLTDHDLANGAYDDVTTYQYGVEITGGAQPAPKKQPHALTKINKTVNAAGSIVQSASTYTYDAAGNTKSRTIDGDTQDLTWDHRNKLQSATSPGIGSVAVTGLSGKCLDVENGKTADGTAVQLLSCNETKPQQWRFTAGTIQALGKCLTAQGGDAVLKACNGDSNQKFTYRASDKALFTGTNQCLTVPNDNAAEGNDLDLYTCASPVTPAQQWSFGNLTSYLYDASGNRVIQETGSSRTLYLGETEITVDKAGKAIDAVRYYTSPGAPTTVRRTNGKTTGHTISQLLTDHHGTATLSVDQTDGQPVTRRRSDPYGNPRGSQPSNWPGDRTFLGTGSDDNTTGLTHIGAREYEASTGRFITVDPVIDITDPLQMNGYTYANGNPITNLDPDGLKYFEGDSDPGFQAEASKVVQVAQKRITKREARVASWGKEKVSKPKIHKKPSFFTNVWTGLARGWASADQISPFAPVTNALGISGRDQVNWLLGKLGVESDENSIESIVAEVLAPLPPIAKGATAGRVAASAVERAAVSCATKNSFVAGTQVQLANGASKAIDRLTADDEVLATDPETGQTGAKAVVATIFTHDDKKYVDVSVQTAHGVETITTTDHHPFWSESEQVWKNAGDLKPGETLRTDDGTPVAIAAIRVYEAVRDTYNLTVADLHTYYVLAGSTPVLVHNCGGELYNRARQLFLTRADENSTVAVAQVRSTSNPDKVETWVATERTGLPDEWKNGNAPLRGERYIAGQGHAEATIMNRLGNNWALVGMASSTRMCPPCLNQATGMGFTPSTTIGYGHGVSKTGNTRYRVVLGK
ncbi:ricin-type beta-trefoil lectin domain protein [Streptomyces sp. XY413]|uniref:ricin-type beta-trefoil lectin domain protein n=1 Tax=Streptomyces sp. XY413 TaxID=1519479 RepID=UPI000AC4A24D|nr:ricin-type beta-trefoil lectin domain protein [Streptomyces sp. XY413]